MPELEYTVPDKYAAAVAEAVLETLTQLGVDWDFDDTSPPDDKGEVTYIVKLKDAKLCLN